MMETIQILSNKRPLPADEDITAPSSKKMMVQPKVEQDSCDLFSLVSAAAEQQRQAQEDQVERIHSRQLLSLSRDGIRPIGTTLPSSSTSSTSAAAALAAAAGRTITFTTATGTPSVYTVPAADLVTISLFRAWVKKCFDIRDDKFTLVDRTRGGRNKEIDSESKLAATKEISILPCSYARPHKSSSSMEETISTDILVHSIHNPGNIPTLSSSSSSSSSSSLSSSSSSTTSTSTTTSLPSSIPSNPTSAPLSSFVTPLPPTIPIVSPVATTATIQHHQHQQNQHQHQQQTTPITTNTNTQIQHQQQLQQQQLQQLQLQQQQQLQHSMIQTNTRIPTARQQLSTSSPAVTYYNNMNPHHNITHMNGNTNNMNSSNSNINSAASNGYHHLSQSTSIDGLHSVHNNTLSHSTNGTASILSHSTNGTASTLSAASSSSSTIASSSLSSSSASITNHINNNLNSSTSSMQGEVPTLSHQELFMYAKSILVFLADKGHAEARSLMHVCPSFFSPPSPPNEQLSPSSPHLNSSTNSAPTLPRVLAQAPPCLIPGYYIFSPVFDSFGEKRKLPIKIEIPRNLVWTGERYKTVATYIGLGPFGDDPTAYVKLEGDHLIGTVASRFDDEDDTSPTCLYVFKNLRLKTRCLIRTVLDVSYSGMRTGRFFFTIDGEVLPTPSRKFEIKAPSGYTIKMVNKNARSNPVEKHTLASAPAPPAIMPPSPVHQRLIQYNTSPPPLTSSV